MRIRNDHALPVEYKELNYLENPDTRYLDTGIVATNKLFEIDMQFVDLSTRSLMGIGGSGSEYWGINASGQWEKVGNSNNVSPNTRCVIMYDVGNITASKTTTWIKGSTTQTTGGASASPGFDSEAANNLRIFKLASSSYNCKMKLFSLKAYNSSNQLINYLIPCMRKIDSRTGVYDVINSNFIATSSNMIYQEKQGYFGYKIQGRRLPSIYQEVEYIAASAGPFIQTDYIPSYSNGFEIYFKFTPQDTSSRYCLAANYNEGPAQLSCELQSGQQRYWMNSGGLNTYIGSITTGINYCYYKYSNGTWEAGCNGTTSSGSYSVTGVPTAEMRLFLDRANRTSTFNHVLKIYSCIIKSQGQIIKRYIPCYRKSDFVIGMYEEISGTFLTNAGSGNFTKGNDVKNSFWSIKTYVDLVPDIYQPVEYIQSSGTQYINTTLPVHMNWKYELGFAQVDTSNYCIWGCFNQSGYVGPNASLTYISNNWGLRWESVDGQQRSLDLGTKNTNKHILTIDNGQTYWDGVNKGITAGHKNNYTFSFPAYLFTINPGGTTPSANSKAKIYSYKVWDENGLLKQYLIPCYRKSDNVVGFYDIINTQFLTNIGTGIFTKGGNV